METDKELFQIFRAWPEMMFVLANLPAPRECEVTSVCMKALQRTMDGLVTPTDPAEPLTVIEIQFQRCEDIYQRIVMEMAWIQQQHPIKRLVQGIICFAEASLDPGTEPWKSCGLVRSVYLKDEIENLEREVPDHPLVAVFKPIFEPSEVTLEKEAAVHYRRLEQSEWSSERRKAIRDVFEGLLTQRLSHLTPQEIAMILNLPSIEDTVCGRELLAKGEARGEARGEAKGIEKGEVLQQQKMLRQFATQKFGRLPSKVATRIRKVTLAQGEELFRRLFDMKKISDLERWLSERLG